MGLGGGGSADWTTGTLLPIRAQVTGKGGACARGQGPRGSLPEPASWRGPCRTAVPQSNAREILTAIALVSRRFPPRPRAQ